MSYNYDFSEEIDRCNTNSVKWDLRDKFFPNSGVTPLWVADSDWTTAPEIIEAMEKRLQHGVFGYTYPAQELKKAICKWYKNQYNWQINSDWIVIINGVVPGINLAVQNFIPAEKEVIIQPPVYYPFFEVVRKNNNKLLLNTLEFKNKEKYFINFEKLQDLIQKEESNPGALILCNPHNPVGRVWNEKELKKLTNICVDNDILIISDEIHADFVYGDNSHIPLASIDDKFKENIIMLNSPTKTFNLAGLKIAYAIIPSNTIREKFEQAVKRNIRGSNIFGYTALETAYTEGHSWLQEQLKYLEENLSLTREIIGDTSGINVIEPEGTFLVWLDFSRVNIPKRKIRNIIFNKAQIGLEPGEWFGTAGEGFYRLNIASPRSRLQKALEKFKASWNGELKEND